MRHLAARREVGHDVPSTTRVVVVHEGLVGQDQVLLEGVVLDLGEFGLGLGREGQASRRRPRAAPRGAADDGLDLAVGGALRVNCRRPLSQGRRPLSYQAPFSVGGEAAVAPSSPKDISIWSAVSSVFVLLRSRYVRETLSGRRIWSRSPWTRAGVLWRLVVRGMRREREVSG